MKSFHRVATMLAIVLFGPIALAQEPAPQKKPDPAAEKSPEKKQDTPKQDAAPLQKPELSPGQPGIPRQPNDAKPAPSASPGMRRDGMVDRRLAAFVRLRELLFEKVKLDTEKRKKIDLMFDDYMAGLLDPKQSPHSQPRKEDEATPQELPELRKKLEAAEKEGEAEKIASLKAKIYCATIVLEPCIIDGPNYFFMYVLAELNDDQRKEFEPVLNRWRLLRVHEIAPDDEFKQLRRSTRDPLLLDGSEDLGKQLDALIIEAYRTVPLGPQRADKAVMSELATKFKPKVLEKLDSKQREHLEKTLVMLKKWDEEDPEITKKTRERLKDHKPSHGHSASNGDSRPAATPTP